VKDGIAKRLRSESKAPPPHLKPPPPGPRACQRKLQPLTKSTPGKYGECKMANVAVGSTAVLLPIDSASPNGS